ncbi:hypothetical protein B0H19DRAFT_431011 [Mycena capillaripes]|nr:hypothetical protein B0H19DRAFT_431011 [Mycena capillaripes]
MHTRTTNTTFHSRPPPICCAACPGLSLPHHRPTPPRDERTAHQVQRALLQPASALKSTAQHPIHAARLALSRRRHGVPTESPSCLRIAPDHLWTSDTASPTRPNCPPLRARRSPPTPDSFARSAHQLHDLHVPRSYHIYTLPSPTSSSPPTLVAPPPADGRTRSLPAPPESAASSRVRAPFGTFEVCGSCIRWRVGRVFQKRLQVYALVTTFSPRLEHGAGEFLHA